MNKYEDFYIIKSNENDTEKIEKAISSVKEFPRIKNNNYSILWLCKK